MSSILSQPEMQVFACPKCGEMINTSMAQCVYCNAPVDPQWAKWASNAQATIASAFNHANNLMLAARGMAVLLVATYFPGGGGTFATIAFIAMIFVFPILVLIWFSKYQWNLQGIDKNHADFKQSRSRIMKAAIVYAVTIIAWPVIWVMLALIVFLVSAL
ncbi:MAG TPA: hypothetical protein VJ810_10760 [Blastocatellia bacterium]|nr:hypothetical protein [Blastocatellia bacterium]